MNMYCLYIQKEKSYFHFAEECPQGIYIVEDYSVAWKYVHNMLTFLCAVILLSNCLTEPEQRFLGFLY